MTVSVLIAEDEQNIAASLRFILERAGCRVRHAGDGEEALAAARAERPDVLILDVMLPSLNGFDVLKTIRGEDGLCELPVLMLTAKGQSRDRETADALGANACVTKPFSNADIVEQVLRLAGAQGSPS